MRTLIRMLDAIQCNKFLFLIMTIFSILMLSIAYAAFGPPAREARLEQQHFDKALKDFCANRYVIRDIRPDGIWNNRSESVYLVLVDDKMTGVRTRLLSVTYWYRNLAPGDEVSFSQDYPVNYHFERGDDWLFGHNLVPRRTVN